MALKGVKKTLLISLILIISAILLYLIVVPIDLTERHVEAEEIINQRINGSVRIGRLILKILPYPSLNLEDVVVDDLKGNRVIEAESFRFRVSPMSILVKKILVRSLTVESPLLFVKRFSNGDINLLKILKEERLVVVDALYVRNGTMEFVDEVPHSGAVYNVRALYLSAYTTPEGITYRAKGILLPSSRVFISGNVIHDGKIPAVSATFTLDGVSISHLIPYLRERMPDLDASGRIYMDGIYTHKETTSIKGTVTYTDLAVLLPGYFENRLHSKQGSADMVLIHGRDYLDLSFEDVELNMKGFEIKGSFSVTGPMREIRLGLSTTPFPSTILKDILLSSRVFPQSLRKDTEGLKFIEGKVSVKRLSLHGTLQEIKKGILGMEKPLELVAELKGLGFRHKRFKHTFNSIDGTLSVRGDDLSLEGLKGRYGKTVIQNMKGRVENLSDNARVSLTVLASLDTEEMVEEIKDLYRETTGDIETEGRAELRLTIEGPLRDIRSMDFSGNLKLKGLTISHTSLPFSLYSTKGTIAFDNTTVDLKGIDGRIMDSSVSIGGSIREYLTERPFLDVNIRGRLLADDILRFMEKTLPEGSGFKEHIQLSADIQGTYPSIKTTFSIDLTPARFFYREFVDKDTTFPISFETTAVLSKESIILRKGRLKLPASLVDVEGGLSRDLSSYNLRLSSKEIDAGDIHTISPVFAENLSKEGSLSLDLRLRRKDSKDSITGKVHLRDMALKVRAFTRPIRLKDVSIGINNTAMDIEIGDSSIGGSSIKGRIRTADVYRRDFEFDLKVDDLFLTKLPAEAEKKMDIPFTGKGRIEVLRGKLYRYGFKDLKASVNIDKGTVTVDPLSFSCNKGRVEGRFVYFMKDGDRLFETELSLADIDLDSLLLELGAKERILSGRLNGRAFFEGRKGMIPLSKGLDGNVYLVSEKGKLWKFIVMSKIFSIVNIISIDELFKTGLPYKRLDGTFSIEDGVISTHNMLLDSDSMRMSAIGTIDIPSFTIDAKLGLHPFVTMDKIISSIPLAGWIIAGEEKSTISMYYEIKGPLNNPDVEPVPVKSLGESILGIFKRLLETPVKAVVPE